MVPVVPEQLVEFVVGTGKGGLPGTAGAEGELVRCGLIGRRKPVSMDKDPLFAILGPADDHRIALAHPAGFHYPHYLSLQHQDRIHPALWH